MVYQEQHHADNSVTYTPLQWGKIYYVGRLTYGYDSRYNVTLSMRRDGSSRFGSNNKWGRLSFSVICLERAK